MSCVLHTCVFATHKTPGDSGTSAGLREVLLQICRRDESSSAVLGKPPHVSSILNVISKQLETKGSVKGLGVDLHDLFVW